MDSIFAAMRLEAQYQQWIQRGSLLLDRAEWHRETIVHLRQAGLMRECKCVDCGAGYLVPQGEAPRGSCGACEEIAKQKLRDYFRAKWEKEATE